MNNETKVNNLIKSGRWLQFLESTAGGLHLNLILLISEAGNMISVGDTCPVCHISYPSLSHSDKITAVEASLRVPSDQAFTTGENMPSEVFQIRDGLLVVIRNYPCCNEACSLSFHDRVIIAKELLDNFLTILADHLNGGQLVTEMSALRHINHIILSMFRGDNNALERAIDLILSALIILFDAGGSWLEYSLDGREHLLAKGNHENPSSITADIKSAAIQGRLGISAPEDEESAGSFLPFMVQECIIVFEIDYLMKMMESRLTLVLGVIKSPVLLIDRRMKICYANKSAGQLLCRSTRELLGLPADSITAPWSQSIIDGSCRMTEGIKDIFNNDLGQRFVDWSVNPLTGNDDIPGWLVIADDRTDYYRLQEIGEQAERMVNTSTLLGILAHEIRNPLATFRGLLQLIRLKKETIGLSGYIDLGIKEIDRVTRLLNDFMLMGKPLDISTEPINLKSFMEGLLPLLQGETNGASVEIRTDFNMVPSAQVDPGQLTQVIINLVRNAFEALDKDGYIMVSLREPKKGWVEITVRDTGPGISVEVRKKLFQPFYTTKAGGTGLGLAASRTIIRNHGGEIQAQNHPEGGAVFSILLPAKACTNGELNKIDLMLVTNDEMLRLPTERVLRAENFDVVSVNSRDNALFMLNRYCPSVIIVENGAISPRDIENIRMKYPAVRILITGEDSDYKDLEDIYFIPKPLNYAKLINKIKLIL